VITDGGDTALKGISVTLNRGHPDWLARRDRGRARLVELSWCSCRCIA